MWFDSVVSGCSRKWRGFRLNVESQTISHVMGVRARCIVQSDSTTTSTCISHVRFSGLSGNHGTQQPPHAFPASSTVTHKADMLTISQPYFGSLGLKVCSVYDLLVAYAEPV